MGNIKDEANQYEPKAKVKNISELDSVSVDFAVLKENDAEFPYSYIEVDGERYKVPISVLAMLKEIFKEKPLLKNFKVNKAGKELDTKYTVITLD